MLKTIWTRTLALLLIGLHVNAVSAGGRSVIACADRTPCTAEVDQFNPTVDSRNCCLPRPCDEAPPAPLDTRCIVTSTPAVNVVLPASIPDLTVLPPAPFASAAALTLTRDPFATAAPPEDPVSPRIIPPDQGQGPRAPPSDTHPA